MGRSRWNFASWLVLGSSISPACAAKKPFNINDDLLAYPQYQLLFPDEYILEAQAHELLRTKVAPESPDPSNVARNDPQIYTGNRHADGSYEHNGEGPLPPTYTYEEMVMGHRRLLCQIPRVTIDESNSTASRASQEADEKNELARATDRGLELLKELEGKCMYYFSGWWSYSFCYRNQIKQFHARPAGGGVPSYPPVEDPSTHSFILGRFQDDNAKEKREKNSQEKADKKTSTDVAELRTKGGSRYLVQHLRGGTKCDLTGRDRRIEVQFHCHPQSTDQIGWIKELTTCSYLMVIYTPRLCDDVAFLPPQQDEVHNIECREILRPEEVLDWEAGKDWYATHQLADAAAAHEEVKTVGGIVIGGQQLVGMEGKKIEKGRVASFDEETVEVILKRENGEIQRPSKQVIKKYNLDPESIEDMKKRLEKLADGKDWTLEVVESNGMLKFQGAIANDEDDDEEEEEAAAAAAAAAEKELENENAVVHDQTDDGELFGAETTRGRASSKTGKASQKSKGKSQQQQQQQPAKKEREEEDDSDQVGSEETFKDEL
ncbi:Uncharacterized protein PECH_006794 [Penicillium ucsense]|uniref:Endoplasmic reticulum lectin n=1 Tax=Penicillium ucsense TaxID=2839758 RepID=A0A8J8WJP7_9EURO|nr:Uncharacterized protein PECM_005142 [Penicillium ucsense]KAF7735281.1 Uncharacterized protein PECH_006794 [Penicillium ucsense]